MKIYIIGPTGSGKSTLSRFLSKKHKIKEYELDLLVYDDENGHIKRPVEVREEMFNKILKKKSWIIEDVGRDVFKEGRKQADIIYYINVPRIEVYRRNIMRWIRQRFGKESYNYPPNAFQFFDTLRVTHGYFKKEKDKLKSLEKYKNKLILLNYKELNKLEER